MASLPAFDTHLYYQKLVKAGFNPEQADVQTKLQSEILSSLITEKLATKEDLTLLKVEIKQDMYAFKTEIKQDMYAFKTEIKEDMSEFKVAIKNDVTRLENKISSTDFKLTWLLGLTGFFGSILTISHLFHNFCHFN
jgi:hypothetical protein